MQPLGSINAGGVRGKVPICSSCPLTWRFTGTTTITSFIWCVMSPARVVLAVADTLRHQLDGAEPFCPGPHRVYGVALLMPALAWHPLQLVIIRTKGLVHRWRRRSAATSRAKSRRCSMLPAFCSRLSIRASHARHTCWWLCCGWSPIGA